MTRHGRPRGRRRRRGRGAAALAIVLPLLVLVGGGSAAMAPPADDGAGAAASSMPTDNVPAPRPVEHVVRDPSQKELDWKEAAAALQSQRGGAADAPAQRSSEPRSIVTHVYHFCVRYPDTIPLDVILDEISRDVSETLKESFGNEGLAQRRNVLEEDRLKIFSVESLVLRGTSENMKCDCNAPGEVEADIALSCEAVESTTLVTHETDAADGEVHYVLTLHAGDISERFKYQSTYVGPLAASSHVALTLVGGSENVTIDSALLERTLGEFFVDDFLSLDADGLQVLHVEVEELRRRKMRSSRRSYLEKQGHSVRAHHRRADGDSTPFSSDVSITVFCEHVPSMANDVDDFLMDSIDDELERLVDHLQSSSDPFLSAVMTVRVSNGAFPDAQSPKAAPSANVASAESDPDANVHDNEGITGLEVAILGVCASVLAVASLAVWLIRRRLLDSDIDMDPCADDIYVVGGKQRKANQPTPTHDVSINTKPPPAKDSGRFRFTPAKVGGMDDGELGGRRGSDASAEFQKQIRRLSGIFAHNERECEMEYNTANDSAEMRNVNLWGDYKSVRHIRPTTRDDEPSLGQGISTVEEWRKLRKGDAKKQKRISFGGLGRRSGNGSLSSPDTGMIWVNAKDVKSEEDEGQGKHHPVNDMQEDQYDSDDSASAVVLAHDSDDEEGGESQNNNGKWVGWQCQPSSSERKTSDDEREQNKSDGKETNVVPTPETDQATQFDSGADEGTGIDGVPLPVRSID